MNPAEVLAIEVRQYVGPGFKTLVPTVIGQTARAAAKATTRSAGNGRWDRESFMAELRAKKGKDVAAIAEKILAWAERSLPSIWWGGVRNWAPPSPESRRPRAFITPWQSGQTGASKCNARD
jgi:hypothetical protein